MKRRGARLGVRALTIGIPVSAAALSAGHALAAPAPQPVQVTPRSQHISYGDELTVTGSEAPDDAGHTVELQYAPRGASSWQGLNSSTVGTDGRFRLTGAPARSGMVRVVDASSGALTAFVAGSNARTTRQASGPIPVDVSASVRLRHRRIAVLAGQTIQVRGRLLPALAGRKVSLQQGQNGSWHTLATARTHAAGAFVFRYVTGAAGQTPIRVRFAGDQTNGRVDARVGEMTVYREAGASWYNDAGNTACGFHAHFGVANRTLPCGTTVSLRYDGRSVTATVDDRGPYVGGRDWDLNENTATALGFGGVGTVWSSQ